MESVDVVLYSHIKWSCDGSFFFVSSHVKILICSSVGELMDQSRIAVEIEDDRFIFCKQHIVLSI